MKLSEEIARAWQDDVDGIVGHGWADEVAQLEAENAALKRENEALLHGRDRWYRRWGIAFDILDTTQKRQYEEEIDAILAAEERGR